MIIVLTIKYQAFLVKTVADKFGTPTGSEGVHQSQPPQSRQCESLGKLRRICYQLEGYVPN